MKTLNKTVKIIAIIIVIIILLLLFRFIYNFGAAFFEKEVILEENRIYEFHEYYPDLEIKVSSVKLVVETGEFKVETNNGKIRADAKENKLIITDTTKRWFKTSNDSVVYVYIPEEYEFKNVKIETGAGTVNISNINTKNMKIDLGAGEAIIDSINVSKSFDLNAGAGSLTISNVNINDFECDLGVGESNISGIFTGNSKINCGVGEVNLNLLDDIENYNVKVSKGLGSVKVNDENVKNDSTIGSGSNRIKVEGGIGEINIVTR